MGFEFSTSGTGRDAAPPVAPMPRPRGADLLGCVTGLAKARNTGLAGHVTRVGQMSRVIASALGLPAEHVRLIGHAAALHDVGKIAVPDSILCKPGPLDAAEWEVMKQHPIVGHDLLRAARHPMLDTAAAIALFHHECFDGSGYPNRLAGEAIPIEGRLVAVCDVYDALREERPYRPALDHQTACGSILKGDGRTTPAKFDPAVLAAFSNTSAEFERIVKHTAGEQQ